MTSCSNTYGKKYKDKKLINVDAKLISKVLAEKL